MREKIGIIAPYDELRELAQQVVEELGYPIPVCTGDLYEGVEQTEALLKRDVQVIISRGGTAKLIKQHYPELPVVEINVTGYDLLRILVKYQHSAEKIAVIGYDNVITGARIVASLIQMDIYYFHIENETQLRAKLKEACKTGIFRVIGDVVTVKTAQSYGLQYELVKSGRETIEIAITEAIKLYEALSIEREKKLQLQAIVDFSSEGIIAADQNGIITLYNAAAASIFQIPAEAVLGRKAEEVIPNTRIPKILETGKQELGDLQYTNNAVITTNRVPIVIGNQIRGVVATFQDVTKIQELEQKIRQTLSKRGLVAKSTFKELKGSSKVMLNAIKLGMNYGRTESTILIEGESGTGKELFAQSIHNISRRKNGPFVAVNCAALPGNLLESELFGYEEGAFTGARKGGKKGLFELAHQGTIFLDEISEMDISVQARILRVLQEREVMRLGDDKMIPVNVRVIAATNRNLKEAVSMGNFRQDLYYRLHVLDITVPPLRNRKEDIVELTGFFLGKYNTIHQGSLKKLDADVLKKLMEYGWPGNVRELEHVIEKMVIISKVEELKEEGLRLILDELHGSKEFAAQEGLLEGSLEEIEKRIIEQVLIEENYNKTKAAQRLGLDRGTLNRKLNR